MSVEELAHNVKNALISTLDIVKENVKNMPDADVMKFALNIPNDAVCCYECRHCKEKHLDTPYCCFLNRNVTVTDYCSFGEKEG